ERTTLSDGPVTRVLPPPPPGPARRRWPWAAAVVLAAAAAGGSAAAVQGDAGPGAMTPQARAARPDAPAPTVTPLSAGDLAAAASFPLPIGPPMPASASEPLPASVTWRSPGSV